MGWLWMMVATALGAEPQVAFQDDGLLHASMTVDAPAEAVLKILEDAARMGRWSKDVLAMDAVGEPAGGCQVYAVKTKGLWNPMTYTQKRCRTAEGYRDQLVESDSFKRVESEWTVVSHGDQTEVRYVGDLELSMPVPKRMLQGARLKAMTQTMTRLRDESVAGT